MIVSPPLRSILTALSHPKLPPASTPLHARTLPPTLPSSPSLQRRVPSEWKGDEMGTWTHTAGEWFSEGMEAEAMGIMTTDDMRHHGTVS